MSETITRLEDYDIESRCRATVVESNRISPAAAKAEVRELLLDVDRSDFPYAVGQSVGVLAPASPEFGRDFHFRLYSVADLPETGESGEPRIKICVRRCSYIDPFNGEEYPGVGSNYLCDLKAGESLTIAGPYGLPFQVPDDKNANLVLIGAGTGIAPFRAFVKHIYRDVEDWAGRIWLFHGARSGLELLYMNDENDEFTQYYDEETFSAFRALSPRPHWSDPISWDLAIAERGDELWNMLGEPETYVYVAGMEAMRDELDTVFSNLATSREKWMRRKAELMAGKRWVELLY